MKLKFPNIGISIVLALIGVVAIMYWISLLGTTICRDSLDVRKRNISKWLVLELVKRASANPQNQIEKSMDDGMLNSRIIHDDVTLIKLVEIAPDGIGKSIDEVGDTEPVLFIRFADNDEWTGSLNESRRRVKSRGKLDRSGSGWEKDVWK